MPEYHVASLPVFITTVRRFCAAWLENIRDTDTDQPIEMDHQAKALEMEFLQLICDEAEQLLAQQAPAELTPAQLRELIGQLRQFHGSVVISTAAGEAAQDLTDGPVTRRTWRQILTGIVAAELSHTLVVSASGTAPEITIAGESARLLIRQAQAAGPTVESIPECQIANARLSGPSHRHSCWVCSRLRRTHPAGQPVPRSRQPTALPRLNRHRRRPLIPGRRPLTLRRRNSRAHRLGLHDPRRRKSGRRLALAYRQH